MIKWLMKLFDSSFVDYLETYNLREETDKAWDEMFVKFHILDAEIDEFVEGSGLVKHVVYLDDPPLEWWYEYLNEFTTCNLRLKFMLEDIQMYCERYDAYTRLLDLMEQEENESL